MSRPTYHLRAKRRQAPLPNSRQPITAAEASLAIGRDLLLKVKQGTKGLHWLGDDLIGDDPEHPQLVNGDTGTSLYSGSAGIGWFLAQLGEHVGDDAVRDCGVQALGDALAHRRLSTLSADGISLFSGASGVALVALQVAQRLHLPALQTDALAMAADVAQCVLRGVMPNELDLIGGRAGIIVALAAIHRRIDVKSSLASIFADACRVAGQHLLDRAIAGWHGTHWPDPHAPAGAPGLCGLAHGTSGIAWALFEIAELTGNDHWAATAREALRYERSWFTPTSATWPDLRGDPQAEGWPGSMTAWCHGGIGIAALRLLMLRHSWAEDGLRLTALADLGAALHSLRGVVAVASRSLSTATPFDVSLCHGLGGAVELFTLAGRVTGLADHDRAATRSADLCLGVPGIHGGHWTNGLRGARLVPGLMTGLAGIGTMLLRRCHPDAIGTPLLPGEDG